MALVGPIDFRRQPVLGVRSVFAAYFTSPIILLSTTSSAVVANVVYYQPIFLPGSVVDRIGVEVTTGTAGNCRVGLYTSVNGVPSELIVGSGALSTLGTGIIEATIAATTLPNDWVWMAAVFDATPGMRAGAAANAWVIGAPSLSVPQRGLSASFTYGALGSTATAPTAYVAVSPIIAVRKS